MNTLTIPTGDAAIVFLAEQLGACRTLTDRETSILHRAIRRDQGQFRRWTKEEDAKLRKMRKAGLGAVHIAEVLGRTPDAVYRRMSDLKKLEKVRGR